MQLGVEPSPPSVANMFSPLVPPHEGIDASYPETESEMSPTDMIASRSKPLPPPMIVDSPLQDVQPRDVVSSRTKPLPPPLVDSPFEDEGQVLTLPPPPLEETPLPATPRTPSRRRSQSMPNVEIPVLDHQRSRSESAKSPAMRHLRRRPLLIDDQSSLNRLTTLFEAHNLEELDHLIMSPVVAESFDAFSRTTRAVVPRPDKIKQITGDDEAQAFHDTKLAQGIWYLRPLYGEQHELQLSPDGSVYAGTLRALVERLTVDFPSEW